MTDETDRPLVTFAVIAYNQERFIREAIEGAFAQTYQPLEIILSDDCSPDRTFEIMQEMAASYDGPHLVRVLRTDNNKGVLTYVVGLGKLAAGEIVILAAGDDVSAPNRTEQLVSAYEPETAAVFSLVTIVDENGSTVAQNAERPLHLKKPELPLIGGLANNAVIQGCAASYRKWVFDVPISTQGRAYAEDVLFSYYIALTGANAARVDVPLVKYRSHPDALSNFSKDVDPVLREVESVRNAERKIQLLVDFEKIALDLDRFSSFAFDELERQRNQYYEIIGWRNLTPRFRAKSAITSIFKNGGMSFKWKAARIFGDYPNYQPKVALHHILRLIMSSRNWISCIFETRKG